MYTVFVLVIWDEGMPRTKQFEDQDEAIEALKDAQTLFTAYLYQCNPDGAFIRVVGW